MIVAAIVTALAGCASKGDVQMVQGEVSLLRAESARNDSTRAALLGDIIRQQQGILDSLDCHPAGRRPVQG